MSSPDLAKDKPSRLMRVIAVTSGKGGVGKSSITLNTAIALARKGKRVCIFDADTGLANINIMLGVSPAFTLEHFFTGEKTLAEITVSGPGGIDIVPGASGVTQIVELEEAQQRKLVEGFRQIEDRYDYLLIDTGAGISTTVLHFVAAAQAAVVVITPEPTSLTDAFSLLKVLKRRGYKRQVQVVINMVNGATRAQDIYRRFEGAVAKYIRLPVRYLGSIWSDETIRNAITLQRPVALLPEHDPSAKRFFRMAEAVEGTFNSQKIPIRRFSGYWQRLLERQQKKSGSEAPPKSSSTPSAAPVVAKTFEEEWLNLRLSMSALLGRDEVSPEQVIALLSSCIHAYGDRLGAAAYDLLHGLLQVVDPDQLDREHRELLIQDLHRLHLSVQDEEDEAATREQPSESSEQALSNERESVQANGLADHGYDDQGFGRQDELIQRIQKSQGDVSLTSLLESIKYASLVDKSPE